MPYMCIKEEEEEEKEEDTDTDTGTERASGCVVKESARGSEGRRFNT